MEKGSAVPGLHVLSGHSAAEWVGRAADGIRAGFADAPYPGDSMIGERLPDSVAYSSIEAGDVERFFAGRDWRSIDFRTLDEDYEGVPYACLTFMTPAAFRYYLPAYMLMSLQGVDAVDVLAARTIEHLVPDLFEWTGDADGNGRFGQNMRGMTKTQRGAVAGFLLAMQEAHGADFPRDASPARALEAYWAQFLPEQDRALAGRVSGF